MAMSSIARLIFTLTALHTNRSRQRFRRLYTTQRVREPRDCRTTLNTTQHRLYRIEARPASPFGTTITGRTSVDLLHTPGCKIPDHRICLLLSTVQSYQGRSLHRPVCLSIGHMYCWRHYTSTNCSFFSSRLGGLYSELQMLMIIWHMHTRLTRNETASAPDTMRVRKYGFSDRRICATLIHSICTSRPRQQAFPIRGCLGSPLLSAA